jgi:hypothetical protein
MAQFNCSFPGCTYSTNSRSKIDYHHVVPREVNSRSKVTIPLCKNHHALIYVPEATHGQHAIKTEESLIILGQFLSTNGNSIQFECMEGKKFFYFPDTGERWDD